MEIKGKIAIITGAASGIGLATARELVRHQVGAVALVDRSDKVNEFATQINDEAGREVAVGFCGDTTAEAFRKEVFATLLERFGPVNIRHHAGRSGG